MKYRILNNSPLEFYDATANLFGSVSANGSNLKIISTSGIIELGNIASDIQVGSTGTAVNWTFAGGGTIGAAGNILVLGASGDTVNLTQPGVTYQYPSYLVRYTDITATNNKINITTQVPGSINLTLPNRPVVGQLSLIDNVPTTSNTVGTLTVAGGVGVTGNVYAGTLNANTGFQLGAAADGVTPIQGTVKWSGLGVNPAWFGVYDNASAKYYGIASALPASIPAVGGYYSGMGVSGTSSSAGTPIFGVLSNSQSQNGLGNTAFTIYGDSKVVTLRNTLDDNRGNANITGNLIVGNTSSNYLNVTGNTTGGSPILSAQGSDTDIGQTFLTKGTGKVSFYDSQATGGVSNPFRINLANTQFSSTAGAVSKIDFYGGQFGLGLSGGQMEYITNNGNYHVFYGQSQAKQFSILATASAVNYLQVTGNTATNGPLISSAGTDTNVDINITPKGTGNVKIFANTVQNGVTTNRTISRNLAKGTVMANLENLSVTVNAAGYPLVSTVTGNMDVFWSWKQIKSGTSMTGGVFTGTTMTTTPLSIGVPGAIGSGGDTVEVNLYEQTGINFYRIYYYQMLTSGNASIIIEKIA